MKLQAKFVFLPPGARQIGVNLAVARDGERLAFFNAAGPLFSCSEDDRDGIHLAAAMFRNLELASATALAKSLGLHRSTVFKSANKLRAEGTAGVRRKKTGPRGPHKLQGALLSRAQRLLDEGQSNRQTAKGLGVSEGTIRHALRQQALVASACHDEAADGAPKLLTPAARARLDQAGASAAGVAVKRHADRAYARMGLLAEAAPEFVAAETVPYAGALLSIPFLADEGIVAVGLEVYGSLRNAFFGLTSTLLTLSLMALLRIKTIDQLSTEQPGELGLLLGLDRAPEQRTVSRKLQELAARELADSFAEALTRRWAKQHPDLLGLLYVDGHVRAYHGHKHALPKTLVARRNKCMAAATDYWVNDARADPLFVVPVPANEGLLETLDQTILPHVRELVGRRRRITLVFDREGWSTKRFQQWSTHDGFDVLTYRKGKYEPWPESCFADVPVAGGQVHYRLAERPLELRAGFVVREVRRLRDSGHQTSVVTTRMDLSIGDVASRMFGRWKQENFFRYMRREFDVDHLPSNCAEPILLDDPKKLVSNSAHRMAGKALAKTRLELAKAYGRRELKKRRATAVRPTAAELDLQISQLEKRCHDLEATLASLPARIPHGELIHQKGIVQLERERKLLCDIVKMCAYRAETQMANLVAPLLDGHEDDPRTFIRTALSAVGDMVPDPANQRLRVRLHGLANARSTRALRALCDIVNAKQTPYPNTDLRLVFDLPEAPPLPQ